MDDNIIDGMEEINTIDFEIEEDDNLNDDSNDGSGLKAMLVSSAVLVGGAMLTGIGTMAGKYIAKSVHDRIKDGKKIDLRFWKKDVKEIEPTPKNVEVTIDDDTKE